MLLYLRAGRVKIGQGAPGHIHKPILVTGILGKSYIGVALSPDATDSAGLLINLNIVASFTKRLCCCDAGYSRPDDCDSHSITPL